MCVHTLSMSGSYYCRIRVAFLFIVVNGQYIRTPRNRVFYCAGFSPHFTGLLACTPVADGMFFLSGENMQKPLWLPFSTTGHFPQTIAGLHRIRIMSKSVTYLPRSPRNKLSWGSYDEWIMISMFATHGDERCSWSTRTNPKSVFLFLRKTKKTEKNKRKKGELTPPKKPGKGNPSLSL